ncbi:MAG: DsbA family protein [Janthinobacterium lividum]
MSRLLAPALLFSLAPLALSAQTSVPPNQVTAYKDTSLLKPPAGAKVAIIEYEDLECPACAHAFPIVHAAVGHYHIALQENDFQIPGHPWSHEAAIFAHYLKAKVSPESAEEYRREVFASQFRIESKEDLRNFTQTFMTQHGKQMPFVVDPTGEYDHEVNASTAQGLKLGVMQTPTIVVVTPTHWIDVKDVSQLYAAIDQAEAEGSHAAPATVKHTAAHK